MLFRVLKRMIERGDTKGLHEKMDIFFAAQRISEEEYFQLAELLKQ